MLETLPVEPRDYAAAVSMAERVLEAGHMRETHRTYLATLNALAETGGSPNDLRSSRSRFNEACAATVYAAARALLDLGEAVYAADPVVLNQQAARVRAAVCILLLYGAGRRPVDRPGRVWVGDTGTGRAAARWLARARRYRRGDLLDTAIRRPWRRA